MSSYTFDFSSKSDREVFEEYARQEMEKKHLSDKLGHVRAEDLATWFIEEAKSEQSMSIEPSGKVAAQSGAYQGHRLRNNEGFVSSWNEAKRVAYSVAGSIVSDYEDVW